MQRPLVLGLGEALWDVDRVRGERTPGGAPVNFAYYATRCGAQGVAISAVGRDAEGEALRACYEQHGIATALCVVDYPTGRAESYLDCEGAQRFRIAEGVAYDFLPIEPSIEALARSASAVTFGTLARRCEVSRATIDHLLGLVPSSALKIFDINLRAPHYTDASVREGLRLANVLKLNDEELQVLMQMEALSSDEDEALRMLLLRYNLTMVVLTAGARYSKILTPTQSSMLPTPAVEVDPTNADTVGAGDAFTGTLVGALLRGDSLVEAHRAAIQEAAEVCRVRGAWR